MLAILDNVDIAVQFDLLFVRKAPRNCVYISTPIDYCV